ncbi:MAG TPA: hypothetical protein VMN03_15610, partial [Burkholderiales bacterium]|nr:hypothetical protein [Burkholderiales bacterium]
MFGARETAWLGTASKALAFSIILVLTGCGERISRDDFDAAVKGQSTSEVAARFGDPDAVDDSVASTVRWTYNSKTFRIEGGTKMD